MSIKNFSLDSSCIVFRSSNLILVLSCNCSVGAVSSLSAEYWMKYNSESLVSRHTKSGWNWTGNDCKLDWIV